MKERITRDNLVAFIKEAGIAHFLDRVETTTPAQISNGVWNKLYAVIAVVRDFTHINYWIYEGDTHVYDVTDRSVQPKEETAPVIEHVKTQHKPKERIKVRKVTHWRYDQDD
jgi:hypothetical protein